MPNTELTGSAVADVRLGGEAGIDPDVIGELRVAGEAGRVGPLVLGTMGLEATAREGVLTVQRARVAVAGGEISARGNLPLGPRAGGVQTLEFRLQGVDPGTLLEAKPGETRLVAPLDMSGRLRATALALDAIEADGEITAWSIDAGTETLVLEKPGRVALPKQGRLTLDDLRLRGSRGHLGRGRDLGSRRGRPLTPHRRDRSRSPQPASRRGAPPVGARRAWTSRCGVASTTWPSKAGRASRTPARSCASPRWWCPTSAGSLEARGRGLALDARGAVGDGTLRVSGTSRPGVHRAGGGRHPRRGARAPHLPRGPAQPVVGQGAPVGRGSAGTVSRAT